MSLYKRVIRFRLMLGGIRKTGTYFGMDAIKDNSAFGCLNTFVLEERRKK